MKQNESKEACPCSDPSAGLAYSVEAVVTVDARGQMVLPKDVRERASISPGDRLVVVFWEAMGDVCCITLVKNSHFNNMAATLIAPKTDAASERMTEEEK